jgi:hypothetical protein
MTENLALSVSDPLLDLMGIRSFPVGEQHPDATAIGRSVKVRVVELLKQKFSPKEHEAWNSLMSLQNGPSHSPTGKQMIRKFDEVLIQEAATLGWRLYCYPAAMSQIANWCDKSKDGLTLLKRFHRALEMGVGVNLGEAKFTINDPRWYETKQNAVKELKYLLGQCREVFRARKKAPKAQEIYDWVRQAVGRLPYWHQNLAALLSYLENEPHFRARLASGIVSRREAPSLFDAIFGRGYNVTGPHARKKISELRALK